MADFGAYHPSLLRTRRLTLEPLAAAHADILYEPLSNHQLYTYLPGDPPTSLEALRARYRRLETRRSPDGSELWLNWAARVEERGYIGLVETTVHANSTAHVAYFVFCDHQRQGFGSEAVETVITHLRDALGVSEARALLDTRNEASWRLLERLGFGRKQLIKNADYFKGSPSDEFEYVRALV